MRKAIQICVSPRFDEDEENVVYLILDDGTLWSKKDGKDQYGYPKPWTEETLPGNEKEG